MRFLNQTHKTRFIEIFTQDKTNTHDNERIALFYIISGNYDLYNKRLHIYNFKKHESCFNKSKADFSSVFSEKERQAIYQQLSSTKKNALTK